MWYRQAAVARLLLAAILVMTGSVASWSIRVMGVAVLLLLMRAA
jgi:hypothetical protein